MPWVNYHSHSNYCDGEAEPEHYIKEALRKGFHAYGCSSHAPVSFRSHWNMPGERLQEYLNELAQIKNKYKDHIQVYAGLEIDYFDGQEVQSRGYLKDLTLDYRIGSVHYLDPLSDGSYFCFDGKPDGFFKHIDSLYNNDFKKAIMKYYHHVRQMVEHDAPDVIGHLDKIKMHNYRA